MLECVEKAAEAIGWREKLANPKKGRGVGIACGVHFTSGKFHPNVNADFCSAGVKVNEDGSVYIFVGPEAPQGWESNWVKSIPGKGWFPYIRCYAPTKEWFDGSYTLPQVEQVDFKECAK